MPFTVSEPNCKCVWLIIIIVTTHEDSYSATYLMICVRTRTMQTFINYKFHCHSGLDQLMDPLPLALYIKVNLLGFV